MKLSRAYHEAGHCAVAALFTDIIELKTLTINENLSQKVDSNYSGGLRLAFISIPNPEDHIPGDKMILIALSGICARTIHSKGISYVQNNLSRFNQDDKLMDTRGSSDDYAIAQSFSKPIGIRLGVDYRRIEWSGFRWIYEYLLIPKVWMATKFIAEALVAKSNQTFEGPEINEVIAKSGLNAFLLQNRSALLSKRYPMTSATLKV